MSRWELLVIAIDENRFLFLIIQQNRVLKKVFAIHILPSKMIISKMIKRLKKIKKNKKKTKKHKKSINEEEEKDKP